MEYTYALIFNNKQDIDNAIEILTTFKNNNNKVPVCSKCEKQVDQKVVNFCNVRYKGRILCRECQKEET